MMITLINSLSRLIITTWWRKKKGSKMVPVIHTTTKCQKNLIQLYISLVINKMCTSYEFESITKHARDHFHISRGSESGSVRVYF